MSHDETKCVNCQTPAEDRSADDPPLTGKFYIRCVTDGTARIALHRDDGVSAIVECPEALVPAWHRPAEATNEKESLVTMSEENWCDATGDKNAEAIRSATAAKRVEVWRVRPIEGGAWLYETKLANLVDLLESETSEGHSFTLEKTSLTEDEAANMGEFDGW